MKFTEKELEKVKKERMEQIDRYLDNEYGCSYTRLEELHDFVIEQDMKHQEEKDKEIERLNNIINELEKYINETKLEEFEKVYGRRYGKTFTQAEVIICNMILNKLQELKGSDKE